jgi:23S rRNA (cytidine1920-2'-O)/16S rRNA (cytidine1409-2'-O)-methyltransferase
MEGMKEKARLDELVMRLGLAPDLKEARALIQLGRVMVNGEIMDKPGMAVLATASVVLKGQTKFVSRGGLKLESAIEEFKVEVQGKICLDVGSSTGGFTDCLLQRGAKKVYALDVGKGLIAQKLRNDPRVVVIEKFNARNLSPAIVPEPIELAVADVSFISLKLILPPLKSVLAQGATALAMVKPQFELPAKLVKKGVVSDPALQLQAAEAVANFAQTIGFQIMGRAKAGVKGPKGNQEYFLFLK